MLTANAAWAERFPGSRDVRPARKVAIIACMDARMPLFQMLGLEVGDAHVLRNAGGVITEDNLRSLAISQHVLGTRATILIHHTDCGLNKADDEGVAQAVIGATGHRPPWKALTFTDVDTDVRASLDIIRSTPYLDSEQLVGTVYDVTTGVLRRVS